MWDWLSKIDPNVVVGILVAVGGYLYHRFVPPTAQQTIDTRLDALREFLKNYTRSFTNGLTPDAAGTILYGAATTQLAKWGLDIAKLPPILQAGLDLAVHDAVAWYYRDGAGKAA